MVYESVPFHDTVANFCSELGRRFGFAAHNGSHMGLKNAHDPVRTSMCTVLKHLQLLIVHLDDGYGYLPLMTIQTVKQLCAVYGYQVDKAANVTDQIGQQEGFTCTYYLLATFLELDHFQVSRVGILVMS